MPENRLSRRTFVKQIAFAGAALPAVMPKLARAASANEQIRVAFVGSQGQAGFSFKNLIGRTSIVAVADVDSESLNKRLKWLDEHKHRATGYGDYRQMFDKAHRDFDAVVVATPDHQHAQAGLRAMGLGKHLYCEKPLAHSHEEVRLMTEMARRQKLSTQMGTQIHAGDNYRRVVEKIQAGVIGDVSEVHLWLYGAGYSGPRIPEQADPVPSNLNWDLWLGPAAERPYHEKLYHPFAWRGWWDFGGGTLSDFGCHFMDLPHWALGLRTADEAQAYGPEPDGLRPPRSLRVEYFYRAQGSRPKVKLTFHVGTHAGGPLPYAIDVFKEYDIPKDSWRGNGILFVGSKGKLLSNYGEHKLYPQAKFAEAPEVPQTIASSPGHHAEWVRAMRGGEAALCNFDYAGPLTESVLLGIVSHRAGNVRVKYDAKQMKVTNAAEANALVTKPYRSGWEIRKLV